MRADEGYARSVQPSTARCVHVKEQLDQPVRENRGIHTGRTSFEMSINC
jgi:hypothetical protein